MALEHAKACPCREGWTTARPRNSKGVDQLIAMRRERIMREIWESKRYQPLEEGVLWVYCSSMNGEAIIGMNRKFAWTFDMFYAYPRVGPAVLRDREPSSWYPVVVLLRKMLRLRWIALSADADPESRPEDMDEVQEDARCVDVAAESQEGPLV